MDRPHCCSVRREEGGEGRRGGRREEDEDNRVGMRIFSDFFLHRYRFLKILKWIKFRVSDQ